MRNRYSSLNDVYCRLAKQSYLNLRDFHKLFCILLICPSIFYSQSSINTTGGQYYSDFGNVSYSVGQLFIQQNATNLYSISEGIFQIDTAGVSLVEYNDMSFSISVFPNPTFQTILLTMPEEISLPINCTIYDLKGRLVHSQSLYTKQDYIQIAHLYSGTYLLKLSDNFSNTFMTSKLIKQ